MKEFVKIGAEDTPEVKAGKEALNAAFNALDKDTQKSLGDYQKGVDEKTAAIMQKSVELEKQLGDYMAASEKAGKDTSETIEGLKTALTELNKNKVQMENERKASFAENIYQSLMEQKQEAFTRYLGNKSGGMSVNIKAAPVTMGVATGAVAPYYTPIVGPAHEIDHARNFIPVSPTVSNLIRYVKFTATSNVLGVQPGIGTAKPQTDYTETIVDAPVIKIAGFINVADEFLEDIVGSADWLTVELMAALLDVEDQQIFKGSGTTNNLSGLYTNATALSLPYAGVSSSANNIDKLAAAMTYVRRQKRVATAAWTSPEDYLAILINKASGSGEYTYPVRFNDNTNMLMIGPMPVLQHTVFNPSEGFVGDFARGARIFQRSDATLAFSDQNNDNFTKNITTARVEERIALANFYPESFVKVTLSAFAS